MTIPDPLLREPNENVKNVPRRRFNPKHLKQIAIDNNKKADY